MRKTISLIFICLVCSITAYADFNVKDYGANCKGATDALPALQAANVDASVIGGTIFVPPDCTLAVSGPFAPSSGVTLRGAGSKTSTLKAMPGFDNGASESNFIVAFSKSDITVRDLGFASNNQNVQGFSVISSVGLTIERCYFDAGCQRMAIVQGASRNVRMLSNVSDGTTLAENICLVDASFCEISGNFLTGTSGHNGVELFLITPGTMIGNRITNNHFQSVSSGVHDLSGIQTVIKGNTCNDCNQGVTLDGRTINGVVYPSTQAEVIGNAVNRPRQVGILSTGQSEKATITANVVRGSANLGFSIGGLYHTLGQNQASDSAGESFNILAQRSTFTGNISLNGTQGFSVGGDFNQFNGNFATDTRTPKIQLFGLVFQSGGDDNIVGVNLFDGNLQGNVLDNGLRTQFKAGSFILNGSWRPPSMTDSSAVNNSVYFSTTLNKLVFKDASGVINGLY